MNVIAVAVRVVAALLCAVAALQLGPPARIGLPDLIAPTDVHDAESPGHGEFVAVLVSGQEPLQEGLGLGILLRDLGVDHPVESTAFLVLATAALVALPRDPDAPRIGVGSSDEIGNALGSPLGRGVTDVLPLIHRQRVHLNG